MDELFKMDDMDGTLDFAGDPGVDLSTDAYVAEGVDVEDGAELAELAADEEVELLKDALDEVELTDNALEGMLCVLPMKVPRWPNYGEYH